MAKLVTSYRKGSRRKSGVKVSGLTTAALNQATALGVAKVARTAVMKVSASPAALVAKQLPGWKLVSGAVRGGPSKEDNAMQDEQGPSLAQLRRKFLGANLADGIADNVPVLGTADKSVQTVQVQNKRGGAIKTADIKNGKVQIVQG